MKNNKGIFLVLILMSMGISYADDRAFSSLYSAHESSWFFLEELVIKQPQRSVDVWFGTGGALMLASGVTGLVTYKATKMLVNSDTGLAKLGSASAGLVLSAIQFVALRTYLLDKAEREHITKMMETWPQIRDKVPHDVWSSLDALHTIWLNEQNNYESRIDHTLAYLKSEIHARFPRRYSAAKTPFFTNRNLHVKVTFNLYKALKDVCGAIIDALK